jgi:hypothetical protein
MAGTVEFGRYLEDVGRMTTNILRVAQHEAERHGAAVGRWRREKRGADPTPSQSSLHTPVQREPDLGAQDWGVQVG